MTDTTSPTALDLLKRAEALLSALHGSVARHDNLAANLGCAGCELRDQISAALPSLAAAPAPDDRSGLRERITQAIADALKPRYGGPQHNTPGGLPLTATAEEIRLHRAQPLADAVLSVLPPAADRAAVLRELEERYRGHARDSVHPDFRAAYSAVANDLSRLAAGERDGQQAQQGGAETRCPNREPLIGVQCSKQAGHEVHSDRPGRIWYPAPDGEVQQPDTETLPSIHANDVQGFCPACGHGVLMLGEGGHVVCTLMDCPKPEAADQLLHEGAAPVAGQPSADTGEEARAQFVRVCVACPECDHTLDENGACANGCHVPPAAVAEPGKEN